MYNKNETIFLSREYISKVIFFCTERKCIELKLTEVREFELQRKTKLKIRPKE